MDEVFNYWHVLGSLIQREVVMKLNFMDRLRLRETSKHENTLVDSLKKTLTLESVYLSGREIEVVDSCGAKFKCTNMIPDDITYVLNGFKIENLIIGPVGLHLATDHFWYLYNELKKININSLTIRARSIYGFRNLSFFLAKYGDEFERFYLLFEDWFGNMETVIKELFEIESIKKMTGLMVVDGLEPEYEIQVINSLIAMNLSIGSQLDVSKKNAISTIENVVTHFHSRFEKKRKYGDEGQLLIISTPDSTKEVMILEDCYDGTNDWIYRVTVVPANLDKSQYEEYIEKYSDREQPVRLGEEFE